MKEAIRRGDVPAHTSSQRQDVLEAKLFGFMQVACDVLRPLPAAGHVQHSLQAAVVDGSAGNHHGGSLLVRAGVSCRMPGHVYEEGAARCHPVKPAGNVLLKTGNTTLCCLPRGLRASWRPSKPAHLLVLLPLNCMTLSTLLWLSASQTCKHSTCSTTAPGECQDR